MSWEKPRVEDVWQAIDAYLATAYPDGKTPSAVAQRVETLRNTPPEQFYQCAVFEKDDPAEPTRYAIRLGNKFYPHMKLVIERTPDGAGHLFRADTHDRHIRPAPDSREFKAFEELMRMNQQLSEAIETEWARVGVTTFKQYLRQDLTRRGLHAGE